MPRRGLEPTGAVVLIYRRGVDFNEFQELVLAAGFFIVDHRPRIRKCIVRVSPGSEVACSFAFLEMEGVQTAFPGTDTSRKKGVVRNRNRQRAA